MKYIHLTLCPNSNPRCRRRHLYMNGETIFMARQKLAKKMLGIMSRGAWSSQYTWIEVKEISEKRYLATTVRNR